MNKDSDYSWMIRRKLFRLGKWLWFGTLVWFGSNFIVFGRLVGGMVPADFVPIVRQYCVPTVQAMLQYQRDHGQLPDKGEDMGSAFDPNNHTVMHSGPGMDMIDRGTYTYWAIGKYNHMIKYDFTAKRDNWSVSGPFTNGVIPVPAVELAPSSQP